MRIDDRVHGSHEVAEPVLVELLRSEALQRLRGINGSGAAGLVRPQATVSRYEHSAGVMLLIRRAGGSLEEQVAGVLHDVAHTAFSHVVDYALGREDEDFHELHAQRIVARSDVPAILAAHGLDASVLDPRGWDLLERPAPQLSADRIDYTLRDLVAFGHISRAEAAAALDGLVIADGRFACRTLESASRLARMYAVVVGQVFMHPAAAYANARLGAIVASALARGDLREDELFGDDASVLAKLDTAELRPELEVVEDPEHPAVVARMKPRLIDPDVLGAGGTLTPCSVLDPAALDEQRRLAARAVAGIPLRSVVYRDG